MNYEIQLKFLRDTLKKLNIQSALVDPNVTLDDSVDMGLRRFLFGDEVPNSLEQVFGKALPGTIYRYSDMFFCKYIYMLLPNIEPSLVFVIGPFMTDDVTHKDLLEIGEKNNLSPYILRQLELYYSGVTVLDEFGSLLLMIDTLAECIWGEDNYTFINREESDIPYDSVTEAKGAGANGQAIDTKIMEARYAFENQIMDAVTHGQTHKAEMLFVSFGELKFDRRVADSMRNLKNYSIICNTLLRKAAEKGGVHPIHLDSLSSSFAKKIELVSNAAGITQLMKDMFLSYCKLVKKHSIRHLSPPVQKAVTAISADLTADLSLSRLAQLQNVSPGYLSAVFKKETGQNVTDYVNQKRMEQAKSLLSDTALQVQTVAQHCGFLDVHYFSKVFKRYVGKTPKEFRTEAHTKQHSQ